MLRKLLSATTLNGIGFGMGFISYLLLARLMSVKEFGLFNFFLSASMTISMFALLGFPQAVMKLIPTTPQTSQRTALWWFTTFTCTLCALAIGAITYSAMHYNALPSGSYTSLYTQGFILLIPIVILRLTSGYLKAFKKPLQAITYEITAREILLSLTLAALYITGAHLTAHTALTLYSVIITILSAAALLSMRTHITTPPNAPAIKTEIKIHSRAWLALALPLMLTVFAQMLMHRTDIIMMGIIAGPLETGIYSLASKLAQIVGLPMMAATTIASPLVARYFKNNHQSELRALFTKTRLFLLLCTISLSIALALIAPYALPLFGQSYSASYAPLLILLIGASINSIWGPVVIIMTMSGQEKATMSATLGAAILNIILNLTLIPPLGLTGAALATAISLNIKNAALSWILYKNKILEK